MSAPGENLRINGDRLWDSLMDMAEIGPGEVLKVMATDPGSVKDFQAFCKQTGHALVSLTEEEKNGKKEFTFFIRKRAA